MVQQTTTRRSSRAHLPRFRVGHWRLPAGLLLLALLASAVHAAAANIYRYVDRNGNRIYASVIPPEYAGVGYEVLNDRGQVVRVVPRTPTAAELAAIAADEEAEREQQQSELAQRDNDNMLIRKYRSIEAFERERDEVLAGFAREIATATASRDNAELELQRREQVVADYAATGAEVPEEARQSLEMQREILERYRLQVERLDEQYAEQAAIYEANLSRLGELLGQAEDSPAQ